MFSRRVTQILCAAMLLTLVLSGSVTVESAEPWQHRSQVTSSGALLQNEQMAIYFPASESGFSRYEIRINGNPSRLMGVVTPFSRLLYLSNDGQERRIDISPKECKEIPPAVVGEKALQFTEDFVDEDGVTWHFEAKLSLSADSGLCHVRYTLSADQPRRIVQFRGPTLFAGESSFGTAKDEAIFPGLEYLVGDERSSSRLAVTSKERKRFAPHPYKVTVPLMAVLHDRGLIGLLWNADQKWDGRWTYPQPVFSSPNWLEDKSNHLMLLSVPGFPWHEEYAAKAATPYPLREGGILSIDCKILARSARNTTDAVVEWLNAYGYPEMPVKTRSWANQIEFSLRPYLSTLWRDSQDEFGWLPWTGAAPVVNGDICATLAVAAESIQDERLAKDIMDRVDQARKKTGLDNASTSLAYGYRFGSADRAVANARVEIDDFIKTQKPDGSWVFNPVEERTLLGVPVSSLGERGEAAVGLSAAPAAKLLRYSLVSGDRGATEAGLRALDFMHRFVRPQGAQSWECPVAAPDLLAASQAVDAYLYGYMLTADRSHLDRAVYWAKTGLPFIYMWNSDACPVIRYASIPVFGASMFTWPWFGRPVQWNGLAYSGSIRRLARYDKSLDWLTLSEGITLSAMKQQAETGEHAGLYPDSWNLLDNTPGRPWVQPGQFLIPNLLSILGQEIEPRTHILHGRGGRVQITSVGNVEMNLNEDAHALWVRVTNAGDVRPATISVAGLVRPSDVTCGGVKLASADTLAPGKWLYRDGVLFISAPKTGTASFRMTYDSLSFTLPVREEPAPLAAYFLPFTAVAGQPSECKLRLRNLSKTPITDISAHFEAPEGWSVKGPTGAVVMRIEPATATDVTFRIVPAYSDSGIRNWIGAGVSYKEGRSTGSTRAGASVRVAMPFRLRHYIEDTRGLTVTKVLEITNPGPDQMSGTAELSAPPGWSTTPPIANFHLAAKDKQALTFVSTAPEGTHPARYPGHLHLAVAGENLPAIDVELEIAVSCEKAKSAIRIDGYLHDWEGSNYIEITQPVDGDPRIRGPEDLSARARLAWDDKFFYLAVEVTDDKFLQTGYGSDIVDQDSVQVAFDTLRDANTGGYEDDDHELGFALTPTDVLAWRFFGPPGVEPGQVSNIVVAIVRQDGQTVYEIGIPWSELKPFEPAVGRSFAMSILVNDDDGAGLKRLEWGGGIAKQKQPSKFIGVRLR